MQDLKLALHGTSQLNQKTRDEIIWIVKHEFGALVSEAGKHLRVMLGPSLGDLNMTFDTKSPAPPPCSGGVLGFDSEQMVEVKATRDLRVCTKNAKTGARDMRRFLAADRVLARALANTVLHELGHCVANLEDEPHNTGNYMLTLGPPANERSMQKKRNYYAGHQSFREDQKKKIIQQLRAGVWLGDLKDL